MCFYVVGSFVFIWLLAVMHPLKSFYFELIRAGLAYLHCCGGYGSLHIGAHNFSPSKHLIFPKISVLIKL